MVELGYVPRLADAVMARMVAAHRAVLVVGPRATGKTTTAGRVAADRISLLNPGEVAAVAVDPRAVLSSRGSPLLVDEWQVVPTCLAAVKDIVDTSSQPGQFILTGSVRGELDTPVWPGTGRLVRLAMYGLTEREIEGRAAGVSWLDRLLAGEVVAPARSTENVRDYVHRALRGGFPEPALSLDEEGRARWMASYVDQVVARDALGVEAGRDPVRLRRYLEALAIHTAEVVDDVTLYTAAGINKITARAYHRLLQNLLMVDDVPAWTTNRLKRLTLAPKHHLVDPALLVGILGVSELDLLADGRLLGQVIESFVVAQIRAEVALAARPPRLYHLRTAQGRQEVDLVIEVGHRSLVAIEVKATASPGPDDAKHLRWLRRELGDDVIACVVLHTGPLSFELGDGVVACPISSLWS